MHFCLSLGNLPKRKLKTATAPSYGPVEILRKYNSVFIGPGSSEFLYQLLWFRAEGEFKTALVCVELSWNWLYRSGWPQTQRDLPASVSLVLGLKVWAIMTGITVSIFRIKDNEATLTKVQGNQKTLENHLPFSMGDFRRDPPHLTHVFYMILWISLLRHLHAFTCTGFHICSTLLDGY